MSEMKDQPIAVLRAAVPVGEISNVTLVDSINMAGELLSGMPWNFLIASIGKEANVSAVAMLQLRDFGGKGKQLE